MCCLCRFRQAAVASSLTLLFCTFVSIQVNEPACVSAACKLKKKHSTTLFTDEMRQACVVDSAVLSCDHDDCASLVFRPASNRLWAPCIIHGHYADPSVPQLSHSDGKVLMSPFGFIFARLGHLKRVAASEFSFRQSALGKSVTSSSNGYLSWNDPREANER